MSTDRRPLMQRALGRDFERLHPQLQRQYGITSEAGIACVGRGIMSNITRGRFYVVPFLALGAKRLVMFPETGQDVPFSIENYAYLDQFGRETLTWTRTFELPRPRAFNETLIYSETRGNLVVYAGSHQHVAVDLHASVDDGALRLVTGSQRLYEWKIGFTFPSLLSGTATVKESYNDDLDRFEISVDIRNAHFGYIFGYEGFFNLEWRAVEDVPASVRPIREEPRE